jgi:hypothetical protein
MNEKLQRAYYIIGIIQRVSMVIVTLLLCGAAYKIYDMTLKFGVEIKDIHNLVDGISKMMHKSWFF